VGYIIEHKQILRVELLPIVLPADKPETHEYAIRSIIFESPHPAAVVPGLHYYEQPNECVQVYNKCQVELSRQSLTKSARLFGIANQFNLAWAAAGKRQIQH